VNLFVAQFVGEMNFVKGAVTGPGQVESPIGKFSVSVPAGVNVGAAVTLAIRPEHVNLHADSRAAAEAVHGKVTSKNYLGDAALLEVEVNGISLIAKLAGDSDLVIGQQATVELPSHRWQVFP
jgi:ABC-type Fe3+/spermidine/putrescine transport system ATPase subunit